MRNSALLVASLLAGVLSCGADVGPEDFLLPPGAPAPVVTDAQVYTLTRGDGGYVGTAVATYRNTTGGRSITDGVRESLRDQCTTCDGLVRTAPLDQLWSPCGPASAACRRGGWVRAGAWWRESVLAAPIPQRPNRRSLLSSGWAISGSSSPYAPSRQTAQTLAKRCRRRPGNPTRLRYGCLRPREGVVRAGWVLRP